MYVDQHGGKIDQKVVLSTAERKSAEQLNFDLEEHRDLVTFLICFLCFQLK